MRSTWMNFNAKSHRSLLDSLLQTDSMKASIKYADLKAKSLIIRDIIDLAGFRKLCFIIGSF